MHFFRAGSYVSQLDMCFISRNCDPHAFVQSKADIGRICIFFLKKKEAPLFCLMVRYQNVLAQSNFYYIDQNETICEASPTAAA